MPFVDNEELRSRQFGLERAIGTNDLPVEERPTTFVEELGAAFRLENTFGSFLAKQPNLPDSVVDNENYDIWNELTPEEQLDDRFIRNAATVDNSVELDALRRQRDREDADRQILQNAYLAPFIAGVADPINLIPVGGTAYKTYKTGHRLIELTIMGFD